MKKFNSKAFFQIVASVCFLISSISSIKSGNIAMGIVDIIVAVIFASVFSYELKKSKDLKRSLAKTKMAINSMPKKKSTKKRR